MLVFVLIIGRQAGALQLGGGGRAVKAHIQKLCDPLVARRCGGSTEHCGDNALAAAFGGGHQIEASGAGVTGLDPVGTPIGREKATVGIVHLANPRIGTAPRK